MFSFTFMLKTQFVCKKIKLISSSSIGATKIKFLIFVILKPFLFRNYFSECRTAGN